jgi:arylamine N-acetyltransferase
MEPCIAINDSASRLAHALVDRYLDLLGLPRRAPSLAALREIVAAHLWRVPFENISKLYYRRHDNWTALPDIERFLSGMERYHFGGTCYANNSHLCELLMRLGYDARLCGADMSAPDVHVAIMVGLEGREYLVDGGYGSPFWDPMPLDLATDLEMLHGSERYVLKPRDADGCSRMEQYNDGVLRHAYRAKPTPKAIADLASVIADSFRPDATFMNDVVAARFSPAYSVAIRNLKIVETRANGSTERVLKNREELVAQIAEHFAIPPEIIQEALDGLGGFKDIFA